MPGHPDWRPSVKPPEPWRDAEKEEDFTGLQQPYRNNQEPDDGGRQGEVFLYSGVDIEEPAKEAPGKCVLF
jgi:hypothetical protein